MICNNKQGNNFLYLMCYINYLKLYNKKLRSCEGLIQVKTRSAKSLFGNSQMVTATA